MKKNLKSLTVLLLAFFTLVLGQSVYAGDLEPADVLLKEVQLPTNVSIQSGYVSGHAVNIVKFDSGESIVLPLEPESEEERRLYLAMSKEEKKKINEDRKEMLLAFIRTVQSRTLSGATIVQGTTAQTVVVSDSVQEKLGLVEGNPVSDLLQIPDPKASNANQFSTPSQTLTSERFRRVVHFLNEAIIVSAIKAYRFHADEVKSTKYSDLREFGLSIGLRGEIQFGMGKYNVMKSLPIMIHIGYNRDFKAVVLRFGFRREKMDSGSALSFGLKLEVKNYRLTSVSDSKRLSVEGVSWYPPSIPVASFVADTGKGYMAEGFVLGLNAADLIPGAYLTNTVNTFVEDQKVFRFYVLPSTYINWVRAKFKNFVENRRRASIRTCQAVFAPL